MKTNFEHNSKSYSIDIIPSGKSHRVTLMDVAVPNPKSQVSRSSEVDPYSPWKNPNGFRN